MIPTLYARYVLFVGRRMIDLGRSDLPASGSVEVLMENLHKRDVATADVFTKAREWSLRAGLAVLSISVGEEVTLAIFRDGKAVMPRAAHHPRVVMVAP